MPVHKLRSDGKPKRTPAKRRRGKKRFRRLVYGWMDRLFGAASEGSLSAAKAVYGEHETKKDFIWNSIGLGAWGIMFPVFTMIITQLLGAEEAGLFSIAFVTAQVLLYLANYGARPYQSSDVDEKASFLDYRIARFVTCALTLLAGILYCRLRGYAGELFTVTMAIIVFRVIDGLADVYEGRLQQKDKLYLAGVSQALRSVLPVAIFTLLLLITRSLTVASIGLAIVAGIAVAIVTIPMALLETPKSRQADFSNIVRIFQQCFPLFIGLFLYNLINNIPKFAIDAFLDYTSQLYFNAIYFPAAGILMAGGLVYKPLILRMTAAWNDADDKKTFDKFIIAIFGIIVAITVVMIAFMLWLGIPIMNFLYGIDFESVRSLLVIMLIAGGLTSGIDFLYQVMAVIRHQHAITRLYFATFLVSVVLSFGLVSFSGLLGACIAYLISMAFLLTLLIVEYVRVRLGYAPMDNDTRPISHDAFRVGR